MIGLPEILIILVLFLMVAGPVVAGALIWKFVVKRPADGNNSPEPKG